MKSLAIVVSTAFLAPSLAWSPAAWAHPGPVDEKGCHYDVMKGAPHCHKRENKGRSYKSQADTLGGKRSGGTGTAAEKTRAKEDGSELAEKNRGKSERGESAEQNRGKGERGESANRPPKTSAKDGTRDDSSKTVDRRETRLHKDRDATPDSGKAQAKNDDGQAHGKNKDKAAKSNKRRAKKDDEEKSERARKTAER